jgi:integrase
LRARNRNIGAAIWVDYQGEACPRRLPRKLERQTKVGHRPPRRNLQFGWIPKERAPPKHGSTESFGKVFARIADDSGIRRFHAHLLRHTWATNWMKQPGADLLTLMRQGGWKRLQMVERYSHAIPVKDRAALPNPMGEAKIVSFSREAKVV